MHTVLLSICKFGRTIERVLQMFTRSLLYVFTAFVLVFRPTRRQHNELHHIHEHTMSKPASSQGKQSSLLGFFTKSAVQKPAPAAAPATNTPRQLPPATPSTATSAGSSSYASGSSSNVKPAVKVSLKSNHAPSNTVKTSEMTIDLSSDGIEEDSISFSKLRDLNSFRNDTQPFGAAGNKSTLGGKAQAALLPRSIPTPPLTSDGEDIASAGDRSNSLRNSATPGASTSASDIGADSDMLYNDDEDDEEHISKRPASKRVGQALSGKPEERQS